MNFFRRIKNIWKLSEYRPAPSGNITIERDIPQKQQLAKVVNIPKVDVFNEPITEENDEASKRAFIDSTIIAQEFLRRWDF